METPLWTLLLLCLCVPARCDCQRDCLSCGFLLSDNQAFSALVCLLECKEGLSPAFTWDLCRRYGEFLLLPSSSTGGDIPKKDMDEVAAPAPLDLENSGQSFAEVLQRFRHIAQALGADQPAWEKETLQLFDLRQPRQLITEEEEDEEGVLDGDDKDGVANRKHQEAPARLSKRFGGFLKGKYGYRKLIGSGRTMQKRYGGFIGIRKSARKWHNQKRFSEFLKQYLAMRPRSAEFDLTDVSRQNEM